ncbi:MAG: GNAT family N-acetyltransferase [Actinomycetota bacterium]
MTPDIVERIARGFVQAERLRRVEAPGSAVIEIDGLALAFAGVREPALNSALVIREPGDVPAAFERAKAEFDRRGLQLGIDIAVGRHPAVDAGVRALGLTLIIKRPGMAVTTDALAEAPVPQGFTVEVASSREEILQAAEAAGAAFGDPSQIIRGFYAWSVPDVPEARCLVAREPNGQVVGSAAAYLHEGAAGILGLGVRPAFQRRGIGAALTAAAVRVFPDADLAWLHPSEMAERMYRSLGFEAAGGWEVWVDRS